MSLGEEEEKGRGCEEVVEGRGKVGDERRKEDGEEESKDLGYWSVTVELTVCTRSGRPLDLAILLARRAA